jgi:hypothetical protein
MSSSDSGTPEQPDPWARPGQEPPAPPPYQQQPYQQPGYQQHHQQPYGQQPPPYGAPPPAPYPAYGVPARPNDGLGLAAMIVGIASLVLMCGYGVGLLGSPVALVMGRISMKRIDRSEGRLGGRGMAQAGFVLGIIGTVLLVLAIIAVVVLVVVAINGGFEDSGSTTYEGNL